MYSSPSVVIDYQQPTGARVIPENQKKLSSLISSYHPPSFGGVFQDRRILFLKLSLKIGIKKIGWAFAENTLCALSGIIAKDLRKGKTPPGGSRAAEECGVHEMWRVPLRRCKDRFPWLYIHRQWEKKALI